ncbi:MULTISPECIES: DUF4232 domain-containing protein [Streptomyces]|uniref:DUF4232 domain-containing protein n=1 Tax=Streptomyces demainii TaxID=588122 RepID=A0ABT9KJJ2_9ACTN|nr:MULTISPECIES: DUF4232 domain-containing protein [Streptomyces]MCO8306048.1 DUF4232 domain-containing protein [Streptomyces sp. RKCA744]MDP9608594.1 hypothetical protein [Streptomyces demainii]
MHVTAYRRGRTVRTIAASMLAVAALGLTAACSEDGGSSKADKAETSASASIAADKGATGRKDVTGHEDAAADKGGSTADKGGSTGADGGSTGGEDVSGVKDAKAQSQKPAGDSGTESLGDCDVNKTALSVQEVKSPVNHLLLKATNGAGVDCKLVGYPSLKFGADAQAATPAYEDSKPQSAVVLAPGESTYAGITTSGADGSGAEGGTADALDVFIDGNEDPVKVELPGDSVFVDGAAKVTYWQTDVQDALSW